MNPIILEGPDGSGKSYLAHALLIGQDDAKIIHHAKPKTKNVFTCYVADLYEHRRKITVYDRLHIGEPIYGQLVRHNAQFDMRGADAIESYITALGGQTVICLPPYRVCFKNWLDNKKNEYVENLQTFKRVYNAYSRLLRSGRPYLWYDYTRHHVKGFAEALLCMRSTTPNPFEEMTLRKIVRALEEKIR